MKNSVLSFILVLLFNTSYSQMEQEEKPFSILLSGIGGLGFVNYNFNNNIGYPIYKSERTEAVFLDVPIKLNVLFHHQALHIGGGLDRRDINIGGGIKRQSISGDYFDANDYEYKNLSSTLYKIYGRGEIMIIQHERGGKLSGFGGFLEGGSVSVNNSIGTASSDGLSLGIGGFYFGQLAPNFYLTVELATGYDRYKTIINFSPSTHNLYSTEIMVGLRVRVL